MQKIQKKLKKIRDAEAELVYADPKHAAKLTTKIVKWKATIFDVD